VIHVAGKVDPVSDMETIEIELMLADIQHLENSLPKLERSAKGADKDAKLKVEVMKKCLAHLVADKPLRTLTLDESEGPATDERLLMQKLFTLVRARTQRDFSRYKRSTVARRIQRRMQLHEISTLSGYVQLLRDRPARQRPGQGQRHDQRGTSPGRTPLIH
jgi:ribosome-binding ATPase YchF (GTP1/OBG family)